MKIKHILLLLCITWLGLTACDNGEHDYAYTITNLSESCPTLSVNYLITNDTAKKATLHYGETLKIADRLEVNGKDIWDIETSASMYKIKSLLLMADDSSKMSESLVFRKDWTGPTDINGIGTYQLIVTDASLPLSKQENYVYKVCNPFSDTLKITAYFTQIQQKTDTSIIGANEVILGTNTIYSYSEEYMNLPKYKTQKLTGLNSITLWHNSQYRSINLTKDTAFFITQQDTCYLKVTADMFN